jgi:hypothetical protein
VTRALHVFVLCAFAVAQPLFELLEGHTPFLRAMDLDGFDLATVAFALVFAVPGALVAAKAALEGMWPRAADAIHRVVVAALSAAIAMVLIEDWDAGETPGWVLAPGAVVAGVLAARIYARARFAPFLLTVLSPALIALPLLFLLGSPVRNLLGATPPSDAPWNVPVVVVVFDGLPLSSLLNDERDIESRWFPNFAAFARDAHFFRNATTVAETPIYALPALATGRYPEWRRPPTEAEHPESLFKLLADTHEMNVIEPLTRLCPLSLCNGERVRIPRSERLARIFADLPLLYLHVALPDDWAQRLASVNARLRRLESPDVDGHAWRQQLRIHRSDMNWVFSEFLTNVVASERPVLHFLHANLPGAPYRYLPSGLRYGPTGTHPSLRPRSPDPLDALWAEVQALQRHLLQVGFADAFLGRLRRKLESEGLYDRALVIVTADHGVSFAPGVPNHTLDAEHRNAADLLLVPLMVKLPGQTEGDVSDRNVAIVDVLPTILDALHRDPPRALDGRSLFAVPPPERSEKTVYVKPRGETAPLQRERRVLPPSLPGSRRTVRTISRSFDRERGVDALFAIGRYGTLAGRSLDDIGAEESTPAAAVHLDDPAAYDDVDPDSGFVPALVSGRLETGEPSTEPLFLAVALNRTIRAATRTFRDAAGGLRFEAMVPADSFGRGPNELEIFLLERIPGGVALLSTEIRPPPPGPDPPSALDDATHRGGVGNDDARGLLALDLPGLFHQSLDRSLDRRRKLLHRLGQ